MVILRWEERRDEHANGIAKNRLDFAPGDHCGEAGGCIQELSVKLNLLRLN
ncbi:MAG: hypothetical protein PWR06_102 [Thermoanaerobacteraceae bacterium]|nr:hypothetical protein [Thermoanaerobacteraceae bacterium]MDN5312136.1 hypothetical protein [Thermoanaerobacteraceae bacterium]